jgi:hypothetical protein
MSEDAFEFPDEKDEKMTLRKRIEAVRLCPKIWWRILRKMS